MDQVQQEEPQYEFNPTIFLENKQQPMLEQVKFDILVPKSRIQYFIENQLIITNLFKKYELQFILDQNQNTVSVESTQQTFDPTSVMIGKTFLKLVARYMDIEIAMKVFQPNIEAEIININLTNKQETFLKRRLRFIGNNRETLTALELLTNTNMVIYGTTLSVVGPASACNLVMKIARNVFGKNILPTYYIKQLMIRRELEKIPELQDADWSDFMPPLPKSKCRRTKKAKNYVKKQPKELRKLPDTNYCQRKDD